MKSYSQPGFTLIEIMIFIILVAILAVIAIWLVRQSRNWNYFGQLKKTTDSRLALIAIKLDLVK